MKALRKSFKDNISIEQIHDKHKSGNFDVMLVNPNGSRDIIHSKRKIEKYVEWSISNEKRYFAEGDSQEKSLLFNTIHERLCNLGAFNGDKIDKES